MSALPRALRVRALPLAAAVAIAAATSAGCGGGMTSPTLFSTDWSDDNGESINAVRRRLGTAPLPAGADVAIGVILRGGLLLGLPLDGAKPWTADCAFNARPIVTGTVVVATCGGSITAFQAKTGEKLWSRPVGGLPLRGAGDDGEITTLSFPALQGGGSLLLSVRRNGSVLRQLETDKELGEPAAARGLAFIPWSQQYVTALDVLTGREVGRVVLRETTSHAWVDGGHLYFGELGVFRFDEKIGRASRNEASHIAPKPIDLPPGGRLFLPATERPPAAANAKDRTLRLGRPADLRGNLMFDGGRTYGTYFRLVYALPQTEDRVAWVRRWETDIIGGAAGLGHVTVCDVAGNVTFLDGATGADRGRLSFKRAVDSCIVHVDAFKPPAAKEGPAPIVVQLESALVPGDPELDRAQRFFLAELTKLDDASVTRVLVRLASDPRTPPALAQDARRLIATRKAGPEPLLEALKLHYDYLEGVEQPPGIGPIAQALAAMKEPRSAPLLAKHLVDPQTLPDDLRLVAEALTVVGTGAQAGALRDFVALNRATAELEDERAAVVYAAEALKRVGTDADRAYLASIARDALTSPRLRGRLEALAAPKAAE